jgi:hypothetical protein
MRLAALGLLSLALALIPGFAHADPWGSDKDPEWAMTNAEAYLRSGPDFAAAPIAQVRRGTALQQLGRHGVWVQVHDPRRDATAYVHSDLLSPAAPPSSYAFASEPSFDDALASVGIATQDVPLYYFPTADPEAVALTINASDRESIVGSLVDQDGATWFRTQDGYYIAQDGLFLDATAADYAGRWLDVSLTGAAKVIAYEGGAPVRSFYAIKGTARWPTPVGTWSIVRRVANETMDSTTIGIPRFAPGGYYLKNVLYTQYFLGSGESLHYNWWSSAWGTQGSHGCLGLSLADSKWLWDWATIGTPVVIHP